MPQKVLLKNSQIDLIRNIPLFQGLTEQEKDLLLQDGEVYSYPRKSTLFIQGDPAASFYIICSGTVQLFRTTPNGHEVTPGIRIRGQIIGEKELFASSGAYKFNAIAVDNVDVLELPIKKLKERVKNNGRFLHNLISSISQSAALTEVEAEHQSTMTAAQLTSCYLQHMCVEHDFNASGFTLPYKKSLIASRLGMELETFSRTLPKLREHGIDVTGTNVTFHDFKAVDQHTCGHCSINDFCSTYKNIRENIKTPGEKIMSKKDKNSKMQADDEEGRKGSLGALASGASAGMAAGAAAGIPGGLPGIAIGAAIGAAAGALAAEVAVEVAAEHEQGREKDRPAQPRNKDRAGHK